MHPSTAQITAQLANPFWNNRLLISMKWIHLYSDLQKAKARN